MTPSPPPLTRRQVVIFTLVAISLGLLLLGLLCEAALRLLGHRPAYLDAAMYVPLPDGRTYGLRPGFAGLYAGGRVRVGPHGLRAEDRQRTGGVLLLGDSANFGQGLDDHQTLAAQAEQRLRRGGKDVPVVNAGVPGYNTVIELHQLRALLPQLQPRKVVLIYVLDNDTDLRPGIWMREDGSLDLHLSQSLGGRLSRLLTRHLVIYAQVRGLFQVRQQQLAADTTTPFGLKDEGWRRSREALLQMRDLLAQRGVPFAVGTIGLVQNLDRLPVVQLFLKEQGIRQRVVWHTGDVAAYLRQSAISVTDSHANAATTGQMADDLLPLIVD